MGRCSDGGGWWRRSRATCRCGGGGGGRLVKAGDGGGGRLRRGGYGYNVFLWRGRSVEALLAPKKRSTELTSTIPTQKSKDASRTQNPPFASNYGGAKPQRTQVDGRKKKKLAKSAPPLRFNIHVPSSRNVFLFSTPSFFLLFYALILAVNLT